MMCYCVLCFSSVKEPRKRVGSIMVLLLVRGAGLIHVVSTSWDLGGAKFGGCDLK